MGARESRMPIGRFAASVRLSIKALRHYDELGLLRPAFVDPQTGYRYYARSQARDLARRAQALRSIQRVARSGRLDPYEVRVREEPPLAVARLTIVTAPERLVPETTELVYRVLDELRAAGRPIEMPVLCVNEPPDAAERIRVHACAAASAEGPALATAELTELPGGAFAWLVHEGPYEELGLAHHALHAWAQEQGHAPAGPLREIYVNHPADVTPEALLTEAWLPIA